MGHLSLILLSLGMAMSTVYAQIPSTSSYGERGSDLGIQLFAQVVRSRPQENVVMSPHSVASILGMLLVGAEGNTRRQILTALRYKKHGPYKMLKRLHKNLTSRENRDLVTIANAIFAQQGFKMEDLFVSTNKANFQCESKNLDFSDTSEAADSINNWVRDHTKGMIPTIVSSDMLDGALTRLVAVNAIYFKGLWKSRFQPENTKMRNFTAGDGKVYRIPMMSQLSVFNIGLASTPFGIKYKVIELPYHGDTISMLIAVPSEDSTLVSEIIPHISTMTIQSWTKLMNQRKVRLLLPKFTVEAETDLEAPLSALGITDMFDQTKANFKQISSEPLHVSKALQKSKIEVTEDGTKASAATTAILLARSSPPWVIVDRPFLFIVRHKATGLYKPEYIAISHHPINIQYNENKFLKVFRYCALHGPN